MLAQIVLVILFIGILSWAAYISTTTRALIEAEQEELLPENGEVALAELTPTVATTPVEFTPNQNETDGIIFAGILMVLIIVAGTLGVIRHRG